jgi:hypothetical protein
MKLQHLFTVNLFIALFFGVACAVLPGWVLQLYGLNPEAGAIWTTRLVGGSILGFASLLWFGRSTASAEPRRAIALALLFQDAIGFIASLEVQLTGSMNALGWTNPILYGILAVGYAYLLYLRPSAS